MVTIKKYSNRRLYDTSRSAYVNLDELADIIRAGTRVEVVDAKTGEDLTQEVLLQVLTSVLDGDGLLPPRVLRRLIQATGKTPMHHALRHQIGLAMEMMAAQMDRMEALFPGMSGFGGQAAAAPPAADDPEPEPEPEPADPAEQELSELRDRLAALEARLKR